MKLEIDLQGLALTSSAIIMFDGNGTVEVLETNEPVKFSSIKAAVDSTLPSPTIDTSHPRSNFKISQINKRSNVVTYYSVPESIKGAAEILMSKLTQEEINILKKVL